MKNIKLIINHDVSFTDNFINDFTKDVLNEFPDEIEDNFIEKFYEIENKYIGLPNTSETCHNYRYDLECLCRNYKQVTGKILKPLVLKYHGENNDIQ